MVDIRKILERYDPALASLRWAPLGAGGGFSGARLWRGEASSEPLFALKKWPQSMTAQRLAGIHQWMAQAAHLSFVPEVIRTKDRGTFIVAQDRVWDVTRWMPGRASFREAPSAVKLENAGRALAKLHQAWRPASPQFALCPAVQRRLGILEHGIAHLRAANPPTALLLRAGPFLEPALSALRPWLDRPVPIQPCLCDPWHDHILFTGGEVAGIIDYGAMKEDCVAVDLARMLGDLAGENEEDFAKGMAAYQREMGSLALNSAFVRLLDRTGIIGAAVYWHLRIIADESAAANPQIGIRLASIQARLDGMSPGLLSGR